MELEATLDVGKKRLGFIGRNEKLIKMENSCGINVKSE